MAEECAAPPRPRLIDSYTVRSSLYGICLRGGSLLINMLVADLRHVAWNFAR